MKTKIIYISGSEVFDMHDIHAAFDQVRSALGLGMDTVLFGVPVDKADALSVDTTESLSVVQPVATADATPVETSGNAPVAATDVPAVADNGPGAVDTTEISEPVAAPRKKSRGRTKSLKKVEEAVETETTITPDTASQDTASDATPDSEKVISILSVLTAKQDDAAESVATATVDATVTENAPAIDIIDTASIDTEIEPIDIDEPMLDELSVMDGIDEIPPDDVSQVVSIDDMITNDTPVEPQEKTLEQLLESTPPLRADMEHEQHVDVTESLEVTNPDDAPDDIGDTSPDDDATLEQLATEFAENQDKIETTSKTENQGKIGKLKNILPFKKARRDDSGLMGDLFGWAGIAANDEDFTIPGFLK